MLTQKYDHSDYTGTNTYFIISKSEKQMYAEMKDFIKEYGTDKNEIWMYVNPVKPSKNDLRPEYSMELEIVDKFELSMMLFYRRVW